MINKVDLTFDWSDDCSTDAEIHWASSKLSTGEKLSAFPRFVDRTNLSRFLVKAKIFEHVRHVQGSIVECGVHFGGGLFTWANLSSVHEPLNHRRRIIGFDTFEGFPEVTPDDTIGQSTQAVVGGYNGGSVNDMENSIEFYNRGRSLSGIPKIELVVGDFTKTWPTFIERNPHLVISLLYLDFDIFLPTHFALSNLIDRMPKGAVIAFDELHCEEWPGETTALIQTIGINNLRIQRLPFSSICWAVLD